MIFKWLGRRLVIVGFEIDPIPKAGLLTIHAYGCLLSDRTSRQPRVLASSLRFVNSRDFAPAQSSPASG